MTNSPATHIIALLVAALLAASSPFVAAAGRETAYKFKGDETTRFAGYGEEKLSTVILTGTLLCSSCSANRLQLLPIPGALVAATCSSNSPYKAKTKKPSRIIKAITNDDGEFIIDVPSYLHGIPDLHKACSVHVLRLPKHSPCRAPSRHGVHDIVLSSAENGIRTYSTGTLYFRSTKACTRKVHGSY